MIYDDKLNVYKLKSSDLALAKWEGEWSNFINCDNKQYWKMGELQLNNMNKMNFTLPSDSRYRPDVLLLENRFEEYAQTAKTHLEEIQRHDLKLRTKIK